jgi:cytochrome c oxidase subunit 3
MAEERQEPALPFADLGQQREASTLAMWLFLATEVMLFGGIFMGIAVYRVLYPEATTAASGHLHVRLGGLNTAVLLTSSLTMACAVVAAREARRRLTNALLLATAALGTLFLAIKAWEWWLEYKAGLMPAVGPVFPLEQRGAELFYNLYFAATGLHALHLAIGVGIVLATAGLLRFKPAMQLPARGVVVEMVGRYWHLVDVVWVFLFPVLYLA